MTAEDRAAHVEREAVALNGIDPERYHEGDVNHVLQPIIGWLRLDLAAGKPISAERAQTVIDRMYQACESERQWLAALPQTGDAAALARVEALAATWQAELDERRIRDEAARYCWSTAARELRAALTAEADQ